MKKNETCYKVTVSKDSETSILIVFSYELVENSNTYFFDLKMVVNNLQHPESPMPDKRQANDKEELFIFGSTTLMILGNKANEMDEIQSKVEDIFGTKAKTVINKLTDV
jgi:hypothetical protein